jgi:peptidoglycan/xylan/chitin deacetylase (PgdA/CDA1 family)
MSEAVLRVPTYLTRLRPFVPALARGTAILMYHKLGRPLPAAKIRNLYVSQPLFAQQLDDFVDLRIASSGLDAALQSGNASAPRAVLTFDDAYRNVHELGLPLLRERGLSAITYVVAGQIGGTNAWDVAKGHPEEPLMNERELRDWLAAGQSIGSHGLNHLNLAQAGERQAWEEISSSKKQLEDRFGIEVNHFCYPYGGYNPQVRDMVEKAGYRTATTTEFGLARAGDDPFRLKRILVRHQSYAPKLWFKRARIE